MQNKATTSKQEHNETLLNSILEKANNIERATNLITIRNQIKETLKEQARAEADIRSKTITFQSMQGSNNVSEQLTNTIQAWTNMSLSGPPSFRAAKDILFVQMATTADKQALVEYANLASSDALIKKQMVPPNPDGTHFTRLPIKLEANNVGPQVKIENVKAIIENTIGRNNNAKLIFIKDGRVNPRNQKRTISIKVNGDAFVTLMVEMNGILPVGTDRARTKLYLRINCRPWQCSYCFALGYHPQCPGRSCANCGSVDHTAKDCPKRTRYCKNCNHSGHRAKDAHCNKYLMELAKEIKKHDFPLEVLNSQDLSSGLIKQLQLK